MRTDYQTAAELLKQNDFTIIQLCEQDNSNKLEAGILFTNKQNTITVEECQEVVQLLKEEGFSIYDCNIRIVVQGNLEMPSGDLSFLFL